MGSILSYISIFISIIIALTYTPIMIRILGQSEFGLYSLIGSLAAYFSVMDLGLGNAMVRYTARNRAIGDKNKEAELNGLFLIFYLVIGLLTVFVGFTVYQNIDLIFGEKLSSNQLISAKVMVIILIINFAVSFPLSVFNSIIKAYERFVVDKLVAIIRIVLSPLIILPIIYFGHGAVAMVIVTTFVNIGCLIFNAYYCNKKLNIKFRFGKVDRDLTKEIIGYSFFVFLGIIVDQIYWQTDQIILGAVDGTVTVAIYAIAMQFIMLYMQFSTSISGLFLPKVSIMIARNVAPEELTNMMIKFGRIQFFIILLILTGFGLFGKPFISIWAGTNYTEAYYIAIIIMIPFTIPLIQNVGLSILYAKNLQGFRAIMLIIIATLNVIVSIPVAKVYGSIGVAIITAITMLLGNVIGMNIYYHKRIQINIFKFWKTILRISLPVFLALCIGFLINFIIEANTLIYLFIKVSIYSLVYIISIWLFGFNKFEKNIITSSISKVKNRLLKTR